MTRHPTSCCPCLHSYSQLNDGFTLLEVMMAVAVVTVGTLGLVALERTTIVANREARRLTHAEQSTRMWLERVQRETVGWRTSTGNPTAGLPYLDKLPTADGSSGWFLPVDLDRFEFPGRDGAGAEILAATMADGVRYCTHVRLTWEVPNQLVRADVRTWWVRDRQDTSTWSCGANLVEAVTAELAGASMQLGVSYGSTRLRWSP